ncbi:MAG: prolyl oligopeptidase family serine peptidase [Longimonas sp.]|uniref:alpha/beta hydrolase family protein n=1 Tax=Longimonas sp. TaxID=2039626 RepID=UPI00334F9726
MRIAIRHGAWGLLLALLLTLVLGMSSGAVHAQQILDHDDYAIWNQIHTQALSPDGEALLYVLGPEHGDDTLRVATHEGTHQLDVPRSATDAQFTADSRYVVTRIVPPHDHDDDDAPDSLAVAHIESGDVQRIPHLDSFALPDDNGRWLAYRHTDDIENGDENSDEGSNENGENEEERDDAGTRLVLQDLDNDDTTEIEHVSAYHFTDAGDWLVYATATPDSTGDGVFALATETGATTPLLEGPGTYSDLALDDDGTQVAFLTNRDDLDADAIDADEEAYTLYHATLGEEATLIADLDTDGIPEDWWVSKHGSLSFSDNGNRLFFGTAPQPDPDTTATLLDEPVEVDIWHWQDERPQSVQLNDREQELRRTFQAVAHLDDGNRIVQLATEDWPNVSVGDNGNAGLAIANTNRPYQKEMSWDFPTYYDVYLIDVDTGEERLAQERVQYPASLSPEAAHLTWWDGTNETWWAQSVEAGSTPIDLGAAIDAPLYDEQHDRPMPPFPYGSAGWLTGDDAFVIYDKFDAWAVDPSNPAAPTNLTGGMGRAEALQFRIRQLDPDADAIDPDEPLMLHAFNTDTKASGYYQGTVDSSAPTELIMDDRRFSSLTQADEAERLLYQREDVREFPNLWTTDLDFSDPVQVSDANPQQADYRWSTAEPMSWTSLVGEELDGILYKPDDFDASETYPLMVYFYERSSDNLHNHWAPAPHRSIINPTFYASRGYVVFVPDIVYEEGYPGESAYNSIMPGVMMLAEEPYIDKDRMGLQGHSWAGYQIAYMLTRTDLFAAAEGGAPVANMTSAYGGIRWGTGRSRMFQYERTQSRIGGTLWEYPKRYWENSPLFYADRIDTPLMMMHNDEDGAVPFEQGVELFMALRRLGQPAWLINYNGEPHWPTQYHLKVDWQMRMQQFFDHYLMDGDAPAWLEEGIPATEKGRTLGYEVE